MIRRALAAIAALIGRVFAETCSDCRAAGGRCEDCFWNSQW